MTRQSRRGSAGQGLARIGAFWHDTSRQSWQGRARFGQVWQRSARLGTAWQARDPLCPNNFQETS